MFKTKKTETCKCDGSCQKKQFNMDAAIKILGGGCKKCHQLLENTKTADYSLDRMDEIELITDYEIIATYGVMSTPALVINEKVVSMGKVLSVDEIKEIIEASF